MSGSGSLFHWLMGTALAVALTLSSACGGWHAAQLDGNPANDPDPPALLTATGPERVVPAGQAVPLPNSVGASGNITTRQSGFALNTSVSGDEYFLKSAAALPDNSHGLMQLYTATEPVCWAIYAVEEFTHDEVVQSLEISMCQPWPSVFYVGVADFASDTWRWLEVALIDETVALLIPADLQMLDGDGRALVCIAAPTQEYVEFAGIAFRMDVPAPPPLGFSATLGDYKWYVELTWEDPADSYAGLVYESILVYRRRIVDPNFSLLAEVPAGTTSYQDQFSDPDNQLATEVGMIYCLRTQLAQGAGPPSEAKAGWVGPAPLNLAAQPAIVPDRIVLTWDPQPYAQSAVLEYRKAGTIDYAELWLLEDVASDSFEHTRTSPSGRECELGQVYDYRLRYIYSFKVEADYASASRQLERPTGVMASCGNYTDKVHLNWYGSYPYPVHDEAISYWIYRDGQAEEDIIAQVGNLQEYDDLTAGELLHAYRIRTECLGDLSDFSDPPAYGGALNGWVQSHFVSDVENFTAYSDMAIVNGKPAMACVTNADYNCGLVFMQSPEPIPDSAEDWNSHEIAACSQHKVSLVEISGRLAVAYTYGGLKLALSSTVQPTSAADWLVYEIADTYPEDKAVAMLSYGDRLWIIYWADDYLWCARATTLHPASAADWENHPIVEMELANPDNQPQVSLAIINSRLALSCQGLLYARATTDTPVTTTDWQLCSVGESTSGWYTELLEIGGKPAIIYCDQDEHISLAQAAVAEPGSSADWQLTNVYDIGNSHSCQSLVFDGLPVVCFEDEGTGLSSDRGIMLATALSSTPAGEADWEIRCILASNSSTWTGSLLELNGGLGLSCNVSVVNQGLVFAYLPAE
ncbi:hypothetical protein JW859_05575 [bacterium]|nr:hypothetical protein [bacterium]